MKNRRTFIKQSAILLGAVGTGLGCQPSKSDESTIIENSPTEIFPTIIATWNNQKATAAAMKVLNDGGSALDAVEAGAKVPEADPKDVSVGYGGHPDRNGIVTLDACIMDHLGNAGSVTFLQTLLKVQG